MGDIIWEPMNNSLLQIKFEKDDIINCFVKHPECHYDRHFYCCEIDLTPAVSWFKTRFSQTRENVDTSILVSTVGKCTYSEFISYVFNQIHRILIKDKETLERGCLLSTRINRPFTIYAVLVRKVTEDLEERLFKMNLEWDGNKAGKMHFTIL